MPSPLSSPSSRILRCLAVPNTLDLFTPLYPHDREKNAVVSFNDTSAWQPAGSVWEWGRGPQGKWSRSKSLSGEMLRCRSNGFHSVYGLLQPTFRCGLLHYTCSLDQVWQGYPTCVEVPGNKSPNFQRLLKKCFWAASITNEEYVLPGKTANNNYQHGNINISITL